MARVRVAGSIVPNDYAWFYRDWLEEECTTPTDIEDAIAAANGEELIVEINSPGGNVGAGSEIYTALRRYGNVSIEITGMACSAASIVAMAGKSRMSPTSLMMVHCASSSASGNHNTMEKTAKLLNTVDEALSNAYILKSGMSREDALKMMENETWLKAEEAVEYGLVDGIMFTENETEPTASMFELPTEEQLQNAREKLAQRRHDTQVKRLNDELDLARARANALKCKIID
ncbi:MAG: Clp protease ClpP [Coriobacteriaceae bacterium]|nr:Clp protease ClpP [Coriobacteriaceae bacterium]